MNKPSAFRETRPVTWQDIHRATIVLARKLVAEGPWHTIAAITRGGMMPAQILAIELGIRRVETIGIASYDGRDQTPPRVLKACEGSGEGWLVVDDIVDTGVTAEIIRNMLPKSLPRRRIRQAGRRAPRRPLRGRSPSGRLDRISLEPTGCERLTAPSR